MFQTNHGDTKELFKHINYANFTQILENLKKILNYIGPFVTKQMK